MRDPIGLMGRDGTGSNGPASRSSGVRLVSSLSRGRSAAANAPGRTLCYRAIDDGNRAGQTLMLSAHARGLGTCWVGSPMLWLSTPEVRAELGIPATLTPVAVLCLGYSAAVPEAVNREKPPIVWM